MRHLWAEWTYLLIRTSNSGSFSILITSPSRTSSFLCSALPCTRLVTSAAIRGSTSTAMTFLACSRMRIVRLPVPGPTSSTQSVGLRKAFWLQDGQGQRRGCKFEIPSTGGGYAHDGVGNTGVLENMLAVARGVELEDVVRGGRLALGGAVVGAGGCAIALRGFGLAHFLLSGGSLVHKGHRPGEAMRRRSVALNTARATGCCSSDSRLNAHRVQDANVEHFLGLSLSPDCWDPLESRGLELARTPSPSIHGGD